LLAGTHLILGGGVPGDHAAKIDGVYAVNIPRVEWHAVDLQGSRGGAVVIIGSPARIVSAALVLGTVGFYSPSARKSVSTGLPLRWVSSDRYPSPVVS
jgi:hypothetical protein